MKKFFFGQKNVAWSSFFDREVKSESNSELCSGLAEYSFKAALAI
jgi:hypothetical protein